MNNIRRKSIRAIIAQLEEIKSDVDIVLDEENEAYENLPESLQESERGERMYDAIDSLESVIGSIEEALEYLESAAE